MKAILILFLLLSSPSFTLHAPDSIAIGERFNASVEIYNNTNSTINVVISLVSPYRDQRTVDVDPQERMNVSFPIDAQRIGEINITVIVIYYIGQYAYSTKLMKIVHVTEAKREISITSLLIGILIFTLAVSVVGYLVMKRRVEEEEEERPHFDRPPWL